MIDTTVKRTKERRRKKWLLFRRKQEGVKRKVKSCFSSQIQFLGSEEERKKERERRRSCNHVVNTFSPRLATIPLQVSKVSKISPSAPWHVLIIILEECSNISRCDAQDWPDSQSRRTAIAHWTTHSSAPSVHSIKNGRERILGTLSMSLFLVWGTSGHYFLTGPLLSLSHSLSRCPIHVHHEPLSPCPLMIHFWYQNISFSSFCKHEFTELENSSLELFELLTLHALCSHFESLWKRREFSVHFFKCLSHIREDWGECSGEKELLTKYSDIVRISIYDVNQYNSKRRRIHLHAWQSHLHPFFRSFLSRVDIVREKCVTHFPIHCNHWIGSNDQTMAVAE